MRINSIIASLTVFLLVLVFGCDKKSSTPPEVQFPPEEVIIPYDSSYSVVGLKDIETTPFSGGSIVIDINKHGIIEREVTFSIHDLPKDAQASFSKVDGYPPFTTTLSLSANNTPLGSYPITIKTHSDNYPAKEYNVNLNIVLANQNNCHLFFHNSFQKYKHTTSSNNVNLTINSNFSTSYNGNGKQLFLSSLLLSHSYGPNYYSKSGYNNPGEVSNNHVRLYIDCSKNTITIPAQKLHGKGKITKVFDIQGSGSINISAKTYQFTYNTSFTDSGVVRKETYQVNGELGP